jgi:hypothetical protein
MLKFNIYIISILIIIIIGINYCNICEPFNNASTTDEFIDYMLNDDNLYKFVLNENSDLSTYLSDQSPINTISKYIENKDNKLKIYNSINKYISRQSGKDNKLTGYISQNGLKMNNVIKK